MHDRTCEGRSCADSIWQCAAWEGFCYLLVLHRSERCGSENKWIHKFFEKVVR